jgi:hypothetical protein
MLCPVVIVTAGFLINKLSAPNFKKPTVDLVLSLRLACAGAHCNSYGRRLLIACLQARKHSGARCFCDETHPSAHFRLLLVQVIGCSSLKLPNSGEHATLEHLLGRGCVMELTTPTTGMFLRLRQRCVQACATVCNGMKVAINGGFSELLAPTPV